MHTDSLITNLTTLTKFTFSTGSAIISMHYESIIARCGSVGIAVATSGISRGKTNCAKLAVAMCGNYPKGCTG